ncbi:MAG: M23 family metallopeptidase [Elusimicrobiota bacterium]
MRRLLLLAVILAVQFPSAYGMKPVPFRRALNAVLDGYKTGDDAGVRARYTDAMIKAFPPAQANSFLKDLKAQYGDVVEVEGPRITPPNIAIFPVRFARGRLDIKVVLDADSRIAGMFFLPHTPAIPVPEMHRTRLTPPFKDVWLVVWGGDAREKNAHIDHRNQRFAFDAIGVGPNGKTRAGKNESNEDFYAFGRELTAPADGVVTDVIFGVRDNMPGSMNQYSALGNAVVLRHAEHEYSVLAHFQQGSIRVKTGDRVRRGQVLGRCGNSGNSSEPHLHFHLQNTPIIQNGTGIKIRFDGIAVKMTETFNERKAYSPEKDDIIRPL